MAISFKIQDGTIKELSQPYIKNNLNVWVPLSEVWNRIGGNIYKIWPDQIVYIHTGYGYNLNMFELFGSPVRAAKYIFINRGFIGGRVNGGASDWALDTGLFPNGSDLTFINEGYVSGCGGDGASFTSSGPPGNPRFATPGGNGFRIRYPVFIDNRLGYIQGGGGGGGCVGDFAGSTRHNQGGGGGAGLPAGRARLDSWGGNGASPGTLTRGGSAYSTARGGDPGQQGGFPVDRINDDYDCRSPGAPGGVAIRGVANIRAGSLGMTSDRILGRQNPGLDNAPFIAFERYGNSAIGGGDGNFSAGLNIRLLVENSATTTGAKTTSDANVFSKSSESVYSIYSPATQVNPPGTYIVRSPQPFTGSGLRFTAGTSTFNLSLSVGRSHRPRREPRSCFIAGSMISMWDGTLKPIEHVIVGDRVKTAVGSALVTGLDYPILGDRPLYAFGDGKCVTSGEHSIWSRDPISKEQWWSTRDMQQWLLEAAEGAGPNFDKRPFDLTEMEGWAWEFATETGFVTTKWHRVDASPETQLYHLFLEEGGSYYVDGYLVSSMADSGGVDWETYSHD